MFEQNVQTKSHSEMIDITRDIERAIPTGFGNGLCHVFCLHTTAGLTINENADPSVRHDILAFLEDNVPWNHHLHKHSEGNSAAHIKASMMGFSEMIPVKNGRLVLGTWQSLYFCEFDGPRSRKVSISFFPEFSSNT